MKNITVFYLILANGKAIPTVNRMPSIFLFKKDALNAIRLSKEKGIKFTIEKCQIIKLKEEK